MMYAPFKDERKLTYLNAKKADHLVCCPCYARADLSPSRNFGHARMTITNGSLGVAALDQITRLSCTSGVVLWDAHSLGTAGRWPVTAMRRDSSQNSGSVFMQGGLAAWKA